MLEIDPLSKVTLNIKYQHEFDFTALFHSKDHILLKTFPPSPKMHAELT